MEIPVLREGLVTSGEPLQLTDPRQQISSLSQELPNPGPIPPVAACPTRLGVEAAVAL